MLFLNSLNLILLVSAIGILIPIIVFATECFCSVLPKKRDRDLFLVNSPKTAILIPAHNEAEHIALVVQEAQRQLGDNDQLVVIADNCQDNTAELARSVGAFVIERVNEIEKGKGLLWLRVSVTLRNVILLKWWFFLMLIVSLPKMRSPILLA